MPLPDPIPGVSASKQKLIKVGNSTGVAIPRWFLQYLGWIPGRYVAMEVLADRSLRLRPVEERDWNGPEIPRLVSGHELTVKS